MESVSYMYPSHAHRHRINSLMLMSCLPCKVHSSHAIVQRKRQLPAVVSPQKYIKYHINVFNACFSLINAYNSFLPPP